MKKQLSLFAIFSVISILLLAQPDSSLISIILKNTSSSRKKVAVISYAPGEGGNGTQIFPMKPGSLHGLQFKPGTKIYIANSQQADSVMSGKRIDADRPFLIIKNSDNQKTFNLP